MKTKEFGGIGFRKFKSLIFFFFIKTDMELLTMHSSLVSQVLKAQYFANTGILSATLRYRPSGMWCGSYKAES